MGQKGLVLSSGLGYADMMAIVFPPLLLLVLFGFISLIGPTEVSAQTNVVFVLTDDQGHWAIHCDAAEDCRDLFTPNLDRLATKQKLAVYE